MNPMSPMTEDEEARLRRVALPLLRAMVGVTNASLVHASAEMKAACIQAARQYRGAAITAALAFRTFPASGDTRTKLDEASIALDVLGNAASKAEAAYRGADPGNEKSMDTAKNAREIIERIGKEAGTACQAALSAVADTKRVDGN